MLYPILTQVFQTFEISYEYAKFYADLFDVRFDYKIEDIHSAILNKLTEFGCTSKESMYWFKEVEARVFSAWTKKNIQHFLERDYSLKKYPKLL